MGILRFGAHFTIAQLCAVSHNIIASKFASKDETTRYYELFPKVDEAKLMMRDCMIERDLSFSFQQPDVIKRFRLAVEIGSQVL